MGKNDVIAIMAALLLSSIPHDSHYQESVQASVKKARALYDEAWKEEPATK